MPTHHTHSCSGAPLPYTPLSFTSNYMISLHLQNSTVKAMARMDLCQSENEEGISVSFGIFMPGEGCHIDDAVAHMADVAAALEKTRHINVAILKSLDRQWAAVFASWKRGSKNADKSALNLPEAALVTKGLKCTVRTVDSGWFQLSSHQTGKGVPFLELLLGDIVSVRRIYCSWRRQDILSYSCLAILRSYFNCMRGLLSYSYDSLDGKQIMGLGVWKDVESASVVEKYPNRNPAMAYWRELGAKRVEYNVFARLFMSPTRLAPKIRGQDLPYKLGFSRQGIEFGFKS